MFAGLCFMILYPVLMILTRSFMAAEDMSDSSVVLFPKHLSLDTLSLAAGMLDYGKSLATTLAVVLTVSLCVPALAANGDQENGGVVGVAPDAQIFSMQVFGCI